MSYTPEYGAWTAMKKRCYYPKTNDYQRYGGSGIAVCDEWRTSFQSFITDVGMRPGRGYSLDRIDGTRGYEPGNVRWATAKQQAANRRYRNLKRDRICRLCGATFVVFSYIVDRGEGHFCSSDCAQKGQRTRQSCKCEHCGATVTRKPSELKKRAHVFCSTRCCAKWRWERGGYGQRSKEIHKPSQPNPQ